MATRPQLLTLISRLHEGAVVPFLNFGFPATIAWQDNAYVIHYDGKTAKILDMDFMFLANVVDYLLTQPSQITDNPLFKSAFDDLRFADLFIPEPEKETL